MKILQATYTEYLIEAKLINIFEQLSTQVRFKYFTNFKFDRYRGDLVVNTQQHTFLIEFDGFPHYTKASMCISDIQKDKVWKSKSISHLIVRIPYFIQLTTETFKFYFSQFLLDLDIEVTIISDFPHGFIDKKVIFPADFCSLGEKRFLQELNVLPTLIYNSVITSIKNNVKLAKDPLKIVSLNMLNLL
jgi:hypothetical protein